ncbi:hypothetical protein HF086_007861 [Spodoptera exigua]|uniref:Ionotropic receptor 75a N-terminal domain-containing protein n=1 Tax=Spodoptera exigua TaxID=7107 RepID=A0A922M291_SPOEX|nr:hypothetical protein HF086_007861 [Spodoptera exigua]
MLLDSNHKWLLIDDDEAYKVYNETELDMIMADSGNGSLIEMLQRLNISVDADIVMGFREDTRYILQEVFNYGKVQGGNLIIHEIGSWDPDNGFNLSIDLNGYKYYRRWDFQNISMKFILVVQPVPDHFDPESLLVLKLANLVNEFSLLARITNRYFHYQGAEYREPLCNPQTDGSRFGCEPMISIRLNKHPLLQVVSNSLYFREQDLSPVIRFQLVQDRTDVLLPPLTSIETRYFYRIPTIGPGKFENQFLRPLSPTAWWSVIGVSALCSALLLVSALFEHRPSSVQYALFSVIASICQQFFQDIDDGGTPRISTGKHRIVCLRKQKEMIFYSVVSWLLNGPPPSINSLKELLESPLELIYEDIGYTRSWLQNPSYYYNGKNAAIEDELRKKKVFNKKKGSPLLVPLVQGIKMVQDGGYAYHTEVNSANALISRTFTQSDLCELGSLKSMEKTVLLMRLSEQGIVSCIQIRRLSFEVKCEGSSPRALALGGAAPAFILLAGGYILATIIMLIER